MLSTPWAQRKNTVRLRDHRIGIRRRHHGGAAGGRQSESEALRLHSGARQGMAARRVSGDAGRRDRGSAQFDQSAGTVRAAELPGYFGDQGLGAGRHVADQRQRGDRAGPRSLRAVPLAGGDHATTHCSPTTSGRARCWRPRRIRAPCNSPRCRRWTGGRRRWAPRWRRSTSR